MSNRPQRLAAFLPYVEAVMSPSPWRRSGTNEQRFTEGQAGYE